MSVKAKMKFNHIILLFLLELLLSTGTYKIDMLSFHASKKLIFLQRSISIYLLLCWVFFSTSFHIRVTFLHLLFFFFLACLASHEFFLFKYHQLNLFYGTHLFYLDLSLFCHHFLVALLKYSLYESAKKWPLAAHSSGRKRLHGNSTENTSVVSHQCIWVAVTTLPESHQEKQPLLKSPSLALRNVGLSSLKIF